MNISRGGLFIATKRVLPIKTVVDLKFTLPETNREILAEGEVVWSWPAEEKKKSNVSPGMGIKFSSMSEIDLKAIEAYVESVREKMKKKSEGSPR